MIIWRDKLVGHACIFYFQSIRRGYFIVEYLASRYYALRFHLFQGAALGQDHPPLCLVFDGFNQGGVAINFMQDNLVSVSPDRTVRELSRLVCVHGLLGFIHIDEESTFFSAWGDSVPGYGALAFVKRTPWR